MLELTLLTIAILVALTGAAIAVGNVNNYRKPAADWSPERRAYEQGKG